MAALWHSSTGPIVSVQGCSYISLVHYDMYQDVQRLEEDTLVQDKQLPELQIITQLTGCILLT